MRHRKGFNHLGRKSAHRQAMLANMAVSLIMHKRITTTLAKAKALRMYVEPLITRSKEDTTHSRRVVFSYLKNKYAVAELFREISPKVADRPGGYTRILKLGHRPGDNAEMCLIELVDYNEAMLGTKEETRGRTRRGRRRRKGGSTQPADTTETRSTTQASGEETAATPEVKEEQSASAEKSSKEQTKAEEKQPEQDAEQNKVKAAAEPAEEEKKEEQPAKEEKKAEKKGEDKKA